MPQHAPTQPTPWEQVVFLDGSPVLSEGPDALFIINRIFDFAFKVDIFLTFNMSYQETNENGGHWVHHKPAIRRNYLRGWFTIDFLSVVPYYAIGWAACGGDCTYGSSLSAIGDVRVIKLVRMIKLARLLKASRHRLRPMVWSGASVRCIGV